MSDAHHASAPSASGARPAAEALPETDTETLPLVPRQRQGAGGPPAAAPPARPPILPSAGTVIQAGAFGAALSGLTTAVADGLLVRAGHLTTGEAVKDVAKAAAQGAATMAVASTVAHMVRARPLIGLAILGVAGVGLLMMMNDKKKAATQAAAEEGTAKPKATTAKTATRRKATTAKPASA
jgi:hypothetical protein